MGCQTRMPCTEPLLTMRKCAIDDQCHDGHHGHALCDVGHVLAIAACSYDLRHVDANIENMWLSLATHSRSTHGIAWPLPLP